MLTLVATYVLEDSALVVAAKSAVIVDASCVPNRTGDCYALPVVVKLQGGT